MCYLLRKEMDLLSLFPILLLLSILFFCNGEKGGKIDHGHSRIVLSLLDIHFLQLAFYAREYETD